MKRERPLMMRAYICSYYSLLVHPSISAVLREDFRLLLHQFQKLRFER